MTGLLARRGARSTRVRRPGTRDLALLAAGSAVSTAGDAAAMVALLLRLRPAGSGWVAALLAAELLPGILLAPLAGRVADRRETWRVVLLALVAQSAVAVPLALVHAPLPTVLLFGALFACAAFQRPATSALIPAITGPGEAARGYRLVATGGGLGWIVGPAAGGALTGAFGSDAALLADAGTFVVLSAAMAFVRARRVPRVRDGAAPAETVRGLGVVTAHPVLRLVLLVSALATCCAVVDNVAAPFRYIDELGGTSAEYGLYLTLWSVGALVGVRLSGRIPARARAPLLSAGELLQSLAIVGIGLAPSIPLAYVASVLGGIGNGASNVLMSALVAGTVPEEQHGRAFSASSAISQTAVGAGTAAGAPLVAALGGGGAMTLAGAVSAVAAAGGVAVLVRKDRSSAAGRPAA